MEKLIRDKDAVHLLLCGQNPNIIKADPDKKAHWIIKTIGRTADMWEVETDKELRMDYIAELFQLFYSLGEVYELETESIKKKIMDEKEARGLYKDFIIQIDAE